VFTAQYGLDPLCYVNKRQTLGGRDLSQAVSRQLLTAEVRIRSQVSPCEICVYKVAQWQVSLPVLQFPPVRIIPHSTFSLYSSSSTCCSYQKDKRAKPGNLRTKQCSVVNRGAFDSKVLLARLPKVECTKPPQWVMKAPRITYSCWVAGDTHNTVGSAEWRCVMCRIKTRTCTVWDSQGGPSWSTENTLMKMVTPYATGRHRNPRATGLDAFRMKWRTSTNIRTDVAPDSTGDRNQDTTATQQVQCMLLQWLRSFPRN